MWPKKRSSIPIVFTAAMLLSFSLFQNCSKTKMESTSLTSLDTGNIVAPTPDPVQGGHETPDYIEKAQVSKLVANRVLVTNYFVSVFGPGIKNLASANIAYHEKDFGSGKSVYEAVALPGCAKDRSIYAPCTPTVTDPQTSSNIGLNVRREAWRIRTCHSAVKLPAQMLYALKKIDSSATSQKPPQLNEENLDKAYRLFFRSQALPDGSLMDALEIVTQKETDLSRKWQALILTLCLSPHWQVL